jgi:hypothetical protein
VASFTGTMCSVNPYRVEALGDGVDAQRNRQDREAAEDLLRAVSVEPNFCRGYAKLAELTDGRGTVSHGMPCRTMQESARAHAGGEQRWLLEEPIDTGKSRHARGMLQSVPPVAMISLSPISRQVMHGEDATDGRIAPPCLRRSAGGRVRDRPEPPRRHCGWRRCRFPGTGVTHDDYDRLPICSPR